MGEAKVKARVRTALVMEMKQAELACRIFEHVSGIAGNGAGRPYPTSPEKSMEVVRRDDPVIFERIMAAAQAAAEYFHECLNAGQVPS